MVKQQGSWIGVAIFNYINYIDIVELVLLYGLY